MIDFTELFDEYYKDTQFTIHNTATELLKKFANSYVMSKNADENKKIIYLYNDDIDDVLFDYAYDMNGPYTLTKDDKNYYTFLASYTILTYSTIREDFDKYYYNKLISNLSNY